MIIIQDFREKKGHHTEVEQYCKENGIIMHRLNLRVGDYMLGDFANGKYFPIGKVSIDTKQDLEELASDLHQDKLEFNKKYRKCFEDGIQLIVLIQQEVKTVKELVSWKSRHSKITGRYLLDLIDRLRLSYGIQFKFCRKNDVGKAVVGILTQATIAQEQQ